jgi:hypothetical protein
MTKKIGPAALVAIAALVACGGSPEPARTDVARLCPTASASAARSSAPAAALDAPLDGDIRLPATSVRLEMFDAVASSIVRLDGDGLVFRAKRRESWEKTVARLRLEAEAATSLVDFGRVFKRLDATYPNLHTRVHLRRELDAVKSVGRVTFPLLLRPEKLDRGPASSWRVAHVEPSIPLAGAPAVGDLVTAINGRRLSEWADENEVFCEFPLRMQCDADLWDNLRRELLSWERKQKLVVRLERAGSAWDWEVPVGNDTAGPPDPPTDRLPCGVTPARYPGFHPVYRGAHACLFESPKHPGVEVMRIDSFQYDEGDDTAWLGGETALLFDNYWEKNAARIRTLVVDVIGNHGGDAPIGYYNLLFTHPFQEQYVRFKRIAEFEREDLQKDLFWGDGGKMIWIDQLRKDGTLAAVPTNGLLPQVPQFCADKRRDCRETTWQPRRHAFRGDVRVLVDPLCISSCVGFVYELRRVLEPRATLFGLPDSGDSAFSRLAVLVSPTVSGKVLVDVAPRKRATSVSSPEPWVRQLVSVTVSTDALGTTLSGEPQPVDVWVPRLFDDGDDAWASKVLRSALPL